MDGILLTKVVLVLPQPVKLVIEKPSVMLTLGAIYNRSGNSASWVMKKTETLIFTIKTKESASCGMPQSLIHPSGWVLGSNDHALGCQARPCGNPESPRISILEMGNPAGVVVSMAATGVVVLGIRKE